jgi:hypothetical protein
MPRLAFKPGWTAGEVFMLFWAWRAIQFSRKGCDIESRRRNHNLTSGCMSHIISRIIH